MGSRCGHRDDRMKTQREDGHLQAKERGPQKKPTKLTPWSWTSRLRIKEKDISVASNPQAVLFCYGSHSKLIQHSKVSKFLEFIYPLAGTDLLELSLIKICPS